jgi:Domain of unknown function (DUF4932)
MIESISVVGGLSDIWPIRILYGVVEVKYIVLICLFMGAATASAYTVDELNDSLTVAFNREDFSAAEVWLARLIEAEPNSSGHLYNMACVLSLQGSTKEALDALEHLVAMGYTNIAQIEKDSDLAALRQIPRYKQIIGELNTLLDSCKVPAGEQLLVVSVPPLMECYAVMLYLGNPDHPVLTHRKEYPYLQRIDAFFADYKQHALVKKLAEMYPGEPWQSNLRAHHNLRTLYIYDDLDTSQIVRYPLEIRSDLVEMVRQFAETSDFSAFYAQNRPFYDAMRRIILSNYAFGANVIAFFNENFRDRFSRFNIYFTPLWGGWQHGPSIKDGDYQECFYFGGCLYSINKEFFYPDQTMQFLALTEFDHATINAITHNYLSELQRHEDKLPLLNIDENSNYGTLEQTLNEYLTWAFALQFFYEKTPDQYQQLKHNTIRMMTKRSFARFEEFMAFYEEYIDNRDAYTLLEDYYPALIDWLAQLQ